MANSAGSNPAPSGSTRPSTAAAIRLVSWVDARVDGDHTDTQAPQPVHPDQPPPADPGLIPLTIPEIKRLLADANTNPRPPGHTEHWLDWRRLHQALPY